MASTVRSPAAIASATVAVALRFVVIVVERLDQVADLVVAGDFDLVAEIADRHRVRQADRAAQAAADAERDPERRADRDQQRREHRGGQDELGLAGVLGRLRGRVGHLLLDVGRCIRRDAAIVSATAALPSVRDSVAALMLPASRAISAACASALMKRSVCAATSSTDTPTADTCDAACWSALASDVVFSERSLR